MNLKIRRGVKRSDAPLKSAASAAKEPQPALDYPKRNEKITSQHYTFRISVPAPARNVEVSINEGPWQPCRNSVGYWWYDWSQYRPGAYKAIARALVDGGKKVTSEPNEFVVDAR